MNILSKASSWLTSNSVINGDNITFSGAGYAIASIPVTELAGMVDDFEFSGTCNPDQSNYDSVLTATVRLQYEDLSIQQQILFLSNNKGTYCRIPFKMTIENLISCSVSFYATTACKILGTYLENVVQATDIDMDAINKELPELLYDYNDYDIELTAYAETTIAMITAQVYEQTDINGHLACRYFATDDTILTVRFYDAQNECIFSPIVYRVIAGDGCLGIPHLYPMVDDGYHRFTVTLTTTTGTVYVDTRSVQYSIDGNQLAEGLEDAPATLTDIAAYTDSEGKIKGVYAISLTSETLNIRHADYKEAESMNWITDFAIEGVDCGAIEFDGNWTEFADSRLLITDTTPYIAYAAKSATEGEANTLYLQLYKDVATRRTVTTGVTAVELLRAWKYIDDHTFNDMGLIIAYIKTDGHVYYRSLLQSTDGGTIFENESEIVFEGGTPPYEHLSLNRLNDYRVEVTVRDSLGNGFALISNRYYQGDSVESYNVPISVSLTLCKLARPVYPVFTTVENISRTTTQAFFNMKVNTPIEDIKSYFNIKDIAKTYTIESIAPIFDPVDIAALAGQVDEDGQQLLPAHCIGLLFTHGRILDETNPGTLTFTNTGNDMQGPLTAISDTRPFTVPSKTISFIIPDRNIKVYNDHTDNVAVSITPIINLIGSQTYPAYHKHNINVAVTPIIINTWVNRILSAPQSHYISTTILPVVVLTHVGTSPL